LIREGSRGVNAIKLLKKDGWRLYNKTEWQGRGLTAMRKLYRERVVNFLDLLATREEVSAALFRERVKNFVLALWRQTKPLLDTAPVWVGRMMRSGFEGLGVAARPPGQEEAQAQQAAAMHAQKKKKKTKAKKATGGKPPPGKPRQQPQRSLEELTAEEVFAFIEQMNDRLQATRPQAGGRTKVHRGASVPAGLNVGAAAAEGGGGGGGGGGG
jgi:hypothetical protein